MNLGFLELNNREIALILWLCIFVVWMFYQKHIRDKLFRVISTLFSKSILEMMFLMVVYVSLIIYLFNKLYLWDESAIKETGYWFIGTAFIMAINFSKAYIDNFFRKAVLGNLKFAIVFEFVINLYVFNLASEIILVPILVIITLMITVADLQKNPEHEQAKKLLQWILIAIGTFMLLHALYDLIYNFKEFANFTNIRDLLLHPVFTILLLPFVYFLALFTLYQSIFIRIDLALKERKEFITPLKIRIFRYCLLNLKKLQSFSNEKGVELGSIENINDVRSLF